MELLEASDILLFLRFYEHSLFLWCDFSLCDFSKDYILLFNLSMVLFSSYNFGDISWRSNALALSKVRIFVLSAFLISSWYWLALDLVELLMDLLLLLSWFCGEWMFGCSVVKFYGFSEKMFLNWWGFCYYFGKKGFIALGGLIFNSKINKK